MDPVFIRAAFLSDVTALLLRLLPLAGFLVAGSLLNALGHEKPALLDSVTHLGVTLMLFSIGLKLNVRTLLHPEVWSGALLSTGLTTAVLIGILAAFKAMLLVIPGFTVSDLMTPLNFSTLLVLAFALSFSSTVFVVKILEKRSETQTAYGRLSIGILIMQDLFAVVFLTFSTAEMPHPLALGLIVLVPLAPWLARLLDRMGHGAMQLLCGIMMALVLGYGLFEMVGNQRWPGCADHRHVAGASLRCSVTGTFDVQHQGAVAGRLLPHDRLSCPTYLDTAWRRLVVTRTAPDKTLIYQMVLMRFGTRHRTSIPATPSLSNYSEFGLIIGAVAVTNGWLSPQWVVVISLALAMSFIILALINSASEQIYQRVELHLPSISTERLSPCDRPLEVGDAEAVVLGMGRIGRSVYRRLTKEYGLKVRGVDSNPRSVSTLQATGCNILEGDAVDSNFQDKILMLSDVRLVVLAMPHHAGNLFALKQLRSRDLPGKITAIVEYPEEIAPIRELGAHAVHHVHDEAGRALANSAAEEAGLASRSEQLG